MTVNLNLSAEEMDAEDLHELARELSNSVNEHTELQSSLPDEPIAPGQRGAALLVGKLVLDAVSSSAAGHLLGVLKSYIERRPELEIELEGGDGRKLRFVAKNFDPEQADRTLGTLKDFFGSAS
jgi:hypothetical protein